MTTQLMKYEPMGLADLEKLAEVIVTGGLFPVWNSKEKMMTLMLLCQAEGIHPIQATNRYDYIQGRIAKKSQAILSDFLALGGKIEWLKSDNESAKCKITTPEGVEHTEEFTMDDARKAQLVKPNSGWDKYPKSLLRARCFTFAIRAVYPQALNMMLSTEEAQDVFSGGKIDAEEAGDLQKKVSKPLFAEKEKPEAQTETSNEATTQVIDAEVVDDAPKSPEMDVKDFIATLDKKKLNAFLKSVNWGTVSKLTQANLDYIDSKREVFKAKVEAMEV